MRPLPLVAFLAACQGAIGVDDTDPDDTDPNDTDETVVDADCPATEPDPQAGVVDEAPDWAASDEIAIALSGRSATIDGSGATAVDGQVTITSAGTYRLTGSFSGQLRVDTADTDVVRLILDGVDLEGTDSAAIFVVSAEDTELWLEAGTTSIVADPAEYVFGEGEDEPSAAIYAKSDLEIRGPGALVVEANFEDGIASKDTLKLHNGLVTVSAPDEALRGKDAVKLSAGGYTLTAGGDAVQSDNDEDVERGNVEISGGVLLADAGDDAVSAFQTVEISGGTLWLVAAERGYAGENVVVTGGSATLQSGADGVNANVDATVGGGSTCVDAGDDGFHADGAAIVSAGSLAVTRSYEALEANQITVSGGSVWLASSDDGVNVSGPTSGGGGGGSCSSCLLTISGGYLAVDAEGDGLDSNGSIAVSGGVTLVNGPAENMNGPTDIGDGGGSSFVVTGGFLVASGSSGMAMAPDSESTQRSVMVKLDQGQAAGTIFHLETADGDTVLTWEPIRAWQSVLVSSADLADGDYAVFLGGSDSGTLTDSRYLGGTYAAGDEYTTFSVSETVTQIGQGGGGPPD